MRPKLPLAAALAPYFESIDESRVYSNFGPLTLSLERRLADHYQVKYGCVVTAANATLGLSLALAVQHPPPGSLCAMPAWTFVASAHAAVAAGLVPYFVDVDPDTWALDPSRLHDEIARAPSPVGAIMPVMPFGSSLDVPAWDAFRSATNLAVVIDAAAGFDSLKPGAVPSVVSLHATKPLGAGEGAFVVSTDSSIVEEVRTRSNFGFRGSRQARVPAFNAKLSEYHAAVAHAALDEWEQTRADWINAATAYRQIFGQVNQIGFSPGFGETFAGSTCVLHFSHPIADQIEKLLADQKIETRQWWGTGAHQHPATVTFPRGALPVTDVLRRSTMAVPFYRDISEAQVTRVAEAVLSATGPARLERDELSR